MPGCNKGGRRKKTKSRKSRKSQCMCKGGRKQRGGSIVAVLREALVPFGFVLANNKYKGKTKRRRGRKSRRRRRRTRRR
tara:strand:- start:50182 stop:50418 length:237 start_codon:yes stop_codon:yes gene_type:complete